MESGLTKAASSHISVGEREYAYRGGRFVEVYAVELQVEEETA